MNYRRSIIFEKMKLENILPSDSICNFQFIGEGLDHIVVSVSTLGQVLSFRKIYLDEQPNIKSLISGVERDLNFLSNVAFCLLESALIDQSRLVTVPISILEQIDKEILQFREEKRLCKKINPFGIALLSPDATRTFVFRKHSSIIVPNNHLLCLRSDSINSFSNDNIVTHVDKLNLSDVICIELKPKQGYLENFPNRRKVCRYCINQYIKLKENRIFSRSSYCPLNLFSGNPEKMKHAIQCLFDNPQNNLKIFKNGRPVNKIEAFRNMDNLIIRALRHNFEENKYSFNNGSRIIDNILNAQKLSVELGILRAAEVYKILSEKLKSSSTLDNLLLNYINWRLKWQTSNTNNYSCLMEQNCNFPYDSLLGSGRDASLLKENSKSNQKLYSSDNMHQINIPKEILANLEEFFELQDFLISLSFKDCSLMLLFNGPYKTKSQVDQFCQTPFWIMKDSEEDWYLCQVTVVDIIGKPASKILKHQHNMDHYCQVIEQLEQLGTVPSCCTLE